jgi:flagella basal body P-ring formation protein FlgA
MRPLVLGLLALAAVPPVAAAAPAAESPALVSAAVRAAAALAVPNATVSLGPVAGAGAMPPCAGALSVSFTGMLPYEQAAAHCAAPAWTLYVSVILAQSATIVLTARPLAAGEVLDAADLRMAAEPVAAFAGRDVFYAEAPLIGAAAVMPLPAGMILSPGDVTPPWLIKTGQTVTVLVISGSVSVSVTAVADEPGRLGDTVLLTNPASGKRFSGLVTRDGVVLDLQS